MTAVATKVSKVHAARAHAKRDHSPKWDNLEALNDEQYAAKFRDAMKYYNLESSGKELKPKVIDWMALNDYSKEDIAAFKKTKDSRAGLTMGAIASCLLKGMPDVRPGFNKDRSAVEWLRTEITNVLEAGANDTEEVADVKKDAPVIPVVTIQDRIRDQAVGMSDELDAAIDSWIMDPEAFDPKEFKIVNLLRGKGFPAPPPGPRSRNAPPCPPCTASAAGGPCRSGHGPVGGGWRHPAGRGWQQAANDPHGLHRRPRDGPTPLRRRIAAAAEGPGPSWCGGVAPPPDHRQVRPHRGRGVPHWPKRQPGDGEQRPSLRLPEVSERLRWLRLPGG